MSYCKKFLTDLTCRRVQLAAQEQKQVQGPEQVQEPMREQEQRSNRSQYSQKVKRPLLLQA
jgi:hypothetical protein